MLKQISDMSDDPAGQYVVLDIVTQISTQIRDSVTAIDAMQPMLVLFEVDELTHKHDVLQQLAKGNDARLKALAQIELWVPTQPKEQVELADGW